MSRNDPRERNRSYSRRSSAGNYDDRYDDRYDSGDYTPPVRKRRRKKRRDRGAIVAIIIFLPIIMALIAACFLIYRKLPDPRKDLAGTWQTQTDISDDALFAMRDWLDDAALGSQVALPTDGSTKESLQLSAALTLTEKGDYSLTLDEAQYNNARDGAASILADALTDLIGIRALAAGRAEESATPQAVRTSFEKAMGLSPEEYLKLYGPELIPPLSEFQKTNRSGRYTIDTENAALTWDDGTTEGFILNGNELLLNGRSMQIKKGDATLSQEKTWFSRLAEAEPMTSARLFPPLTLTAHAESFRIAENLTAVTGSGTNRTVKALHFDYENNRYLSLRDLAGALAGTEREFSVSVDGSKITIDTNGSYSAQDGDNDPFDLSNFETYSTGDLKSNEMVVDGRNVKYYTFIGRNTAGKNDCFICLIDFALIMDINLDVSNGVLTIDATSRPLTIDMEKMREGGFYEEMRSAVVGDATTGEIFESYRDDLPVPIASTTKLMSYAVIMDAVSAGEITTSDVVTISADVADLSMGPDRVIPMKEGQQANFGDLITGMLVASSNECAQALAEHVAGSEEAFVERMRKKAVEIGLSDASVFYNCNGLPVFADDISTAKRQNMMSARDLFKLASWILNVYPQITEITQIKTAGLTSLQMDIKTTNALLYNLPNTIGLKTGTTNMAGPCLVAATRVEAAGGSHDIVSVVLGAEDNTVRFSSSEVLLKFGEQSALGEAALDTAAEEDHPGIAELIIRRVLKEIP